MGAIPQWILLLFINAAGATFADPITYGTEVQCEQAGQHAIDKAKEREANWNLGFLCVPDAVSVQRGEAT